MIVITIIIDCIVPLGLESRKIPDSQITASSSRPANLPKYGRLSNSKYWCAANNKKTEYLQIDLGKVCFCELWFCTNIKATSNLDFGSMVYNLCLTGSAFATNFIAFLVGIIYTFRVHYKHFALFLHCVLVFHFTYYV